MRAPFYDLRIWRRVFLKVLLTVFILEALFIVFRPFDAIQYTSIYGLLVPLRSRLIIPDLDLSDQNVPFETLLSAHQISTPKATNEFRVAVLGDSGIAGWGNTDGETISSYLNSRDQKINSKQLAAYNLGATWPGAIRDLVVADAALGYHVDLFVWFVSPVSFQNDSPNPFLEENSPRLTKIVSLYHLTDVDSAQFGHYVDSWEENSFLAKRSRILHWLRFQTYVFKDNNNTHPKHNLPDLLAPPNYLNTPNPTWAALSVLPQLTNVPILIVNEPILVTPEDKPGAQVSYNTFFGRQMYNNYRKAFVSYCKEYALWCLDIWNIVPASDYTDTPLHRTPAGNAIIASHVLQEIQKQDAHRSSIF